MPTITSTFRCTACARTRSKLQMTTMSVRDRWCQHCHGMYIEWQIITRPGMRGLNPLQAEREFVMLVKKGGDINNAYPVSDGEADLEAGEVRGLDEGAARR